MEVIVAVVSSTQNLGGLMRAEFEWPRIRRTYCRNGDLRQKKIKPLLCFCVSLCISVQHICVHGQRHSKSLKQVWQTWGCRRAPVMTQFVDSPATIDQMRHFPNVKCEWRYTWITEWLGRLPEWTSAYGIDTICVCCQWAHMSHDWCLWFCCPPPGTSRGCRCRGQARREGCKGNSRFIFWGVNVS